MYFYELFEWELVNCVDDSCSACNSINGYCTKCSGDYVLVDGVCELISCTSAQYYDEKD